MKDAAEVLKRREALVFPTKETQSLSSIRAEQVAQTRALLDRDITTAPRWTWRSLHELTGPMMSGDLVVVGALMGNGKSSFLMTQMDAFAAGRISTLYIPLEIDPAINRLRWAAWRLGLDAECAIQQDWGKMPEGSHESIDGILEEQEQNHLVNFADAKQITLSEMHRLCKQAVDETGCRVVMLDHLHRMDFGKEASNRRVAATDIVRGLKDIARTLGIVMIAAAQLNRSGDPVDAYMAPTLARLKETAAIGEEADIVLMLSRKMKRDLPKGWANDLRTGRQSELDIAEPNAMLVTCRKHRLKDSAMNRGRTLTVSNGRVFDRAASWHNERDTTVYGGTI